MIHELQSRFHLLFVLNISFLSQGKNTLNGHIEIAPPGQEEWREAPGWLFKHHVESIRSTPNWIQEN